MNGFLFFAFLVAIYAIIQNTKKRRSTDSSGPPPYFAKPILTEPEQVLFNRLKTALPDKHVMAQVSMAAIIGIRKNANWQRQFNEISRKYVDFVVCNPDFSISAIIELDDATHQRGERIKADAIKDAAFKLCNIKMIRFHVREIPDAAEIRLRIDS